MKILGIEFNEKGITSKNINIVIDMIKKELFIITLERIIISKTFILSKRWYVSNFICISEQNIAKIEKTIYEFIWSNSFELLWIPVSLKKSFKMTSFNKKFMLFHVISCLKEKNNKL
jgi:hypothetical protein